MGYTTRFDGRLLFSRALTYEEQQAMPEAEDFQLVVSEEPRELPEGRMTVITAIGIEAKPYEEMRAYDAVAQLERLVKALPEGVEVSGEIRGKGEATGDIRRYLWTDQDYEGGRWPDGRIVELKPKLLWPDGLEEKADDV